MPSIARHGRTTLLALLLLTAGLVGCGDDDDGGGGGDDATATTADEAVADETETDDETESESESEPAGEEVSIPIVTVTTSSEEGPDGATIYAFDIAQDLTAGPTQLNLANEGTSPHHAQLFLLNDGTTMEQFTTTLQSGDIGALLGIGAFVGGTGVADPGSESAADALVDLVEGDYVLLCFIEDEAGVPHLASGMVAPFSVAAADGEVAELPEPDATIELVDFGFEAAIPSSGVVEVVNTSEMQLHELNLLRLADGSSVDDAVSFFREPAGPPSFAGIGGMQAIMPGASQLLVVEDLEPGDYAMICAVPDPADGVPHVQKGMARQVTFS